MRYLALVLICCNVSNLAAQSPAATADDKADATADIILANGIVIDGTGSTGRVADVAIRDGRIVGVGSDLDITASFEIDCAGLVVCPGFIDLHNHSDRQIVARETRAALNYLTQGCTTIVTGNCGSGPVDTGDYYEQIDEHGSGPNVAHLIPQGSLRREVMGSGLGVPTADQSLRMRQLARKAMQDGAWGMSTGLIYVPSSYASTEELIDLAKVVAEFHGIYASHIRGEGTVLLTSVNEALKIGAESGCPVHISHFKSSGRDAWGLVRRAADLIEKHQQQGQRVTADQYPYMASSTSLGATLLPSWAREGGSQDLIKRLDDPQTGPKLKSIISDALAKRGDGEAVRIARFSKRRNWVGKNLKQIADSEGMTPLEVSLEVLRNGGAQIVHFSMDEADVRHVMQRPWVATASDGRAYLPGSDRPHPRNYGTFPRKIGYYARMEQVISLEAAIRSATGLPAEILGLTDRGRIKTGQAADIAVFDPETLLDAATFDDPHQYSQGVRYLLVNGIPAIHQGRPTGALAGIALRHTSPEKPNPPKEAARKGAAQ